MEALALYVLARGYQPAVVNPSPKADRCDEWLINGFNLFWLLGQDNARRNNKTKENRRMDG